MQSTLSPIQLQGLRHIAIEAAQEAGQWIEQVDRTKLSREFKDAGSTDASQLVTQVDIASEEIIRNRLPSVSGNFDIAFLGEESSLSTSDDAQDRFEKPYFWCVDPLDGTLPFTQGRSGYAVSIALLDQSGTPLIGVVYHPSSKTILHAIQGQGTNLAKLQSSIGDRSLGGYTLGGYTLKPDCTLNQLTVYADASFKAHPSYHSAIAAIESCAHKLGLSSIDFVYGNGAVVNACKVINSKHALYLKLPKKEQGGGSVWDFAATACIANEAGAWVSDIDGQPLMLNRRGSTFMNQSGIVYASSRQIAQCLIYAL